MNYNEYDSNGNKKKFDLSSIINDKTQRSRFLLFIYLVLFIILIFFIRANIKSSQLVKDTNDNINNEEENNQNITDTEENNNLDDMFSFIDLNNYDFTYNISMNDSISIINGKRYNDKYSFTLENNGSLLYFNGTSNYIRAKETIDGEYKLTGFPYVLINCFDNQVIKELIKSSIINDETYEITSESIGNIIKQSLVNGNDLNTIKLIKNNNKITEIDINISDAISSYMNEKYTTIITLKYSNFGLVDDFKIE